MALSGNEANMEQIKFGVQRPMVKIK